MSRIYGRKEVVTFLVSFVLPFINQKRGAQTGTSKQRNKERIAVCGNSYKYQLAKNRRISLTESKESPLFANSFFSVSTQFGGNRGLKSGFSPSKAGLFDERRVYSDKKKGSYQKKTGTFVSKDYTLLARCLLLFLFSLNVIAVFFIYYR